MINHDKWINSLPTTAELNQTINPLDHDKWVNTLPKKNKYNSVKKYSLLATLFVCGLLFVSAVKNETRNLQREINNLEASVKETKFDLDQAILDNEVITSPENISLLAREYLDTDFISYKKSQIRSLNKNYEKLTKENKIQKDKSEKSKVKKLQASLKTNVSKKIKEKKTEIRKLQDLYSNPKSIPGEIKTHVAVKIQKKKVELKNIYNEPKDIFTLERVGKWSVIQVVKLFLGVPIVPGK
tara:strand:- start:360 stop:1082 length:723 start_codon:yes stop_codon:yes gene_type:complete